MAESSEIRLLNCLSSSCPPPSADGKSGYPNAMSSSSSSPGSSSSEAKSEAAADGNRWWLPCRGTEGRAIDAFIRGRLSTRSNAGSKSRALYIAGKPGTGKTASVTRVLERIESYALEPGVTKGSNPTLRPFRLVRINGNHLLGNSSVNVFSEIARQTGAGGVDPDGISAARGNSRNSRADTIADLERVFVPKRKPSRRTKMTIIVIDEIDALLEVGNGGTGGGGGRQNGSKASSSSVATQEALYRLFEWPCRKHSTVVLVSIANRIDLLSRFLPFLGRRGIEPKQIIFKPYNASAVLEILQTRLRAAGAAVGGANTVIKPEALELLARTIAKKSGDARRALDLFRRTVELKLQKVRKKKAARKRKREATEGEGLAPGDVAADPDSSLSTQARIRQVSQAIHASYGSRCVSNIRALSREAKVILCVFVCAMQRQDEEAAQAREDAEADASSSSSTALMKKAPKTTVLGLHELYSKHSRRVSHSPVPLSTFVDLIQDLLNEAVLALVKPQKRLDRRSELKPRVQMKDVETALLPIEGTVAARAKDAPPQPEIRFYKRLMAAHKGPRGSYYMTADGRSRANPGPEPSP